MNRDYHFFEIGKLLTSAVTTINLPKGFIAAVVSFWAWLSPKEATVLIIFALFLMVVLDFITGVRASLKEGKFLQSRLWNRIVDKAVAYGTLSILAITLPKYAAGQWLLTFPIDCLLVLVAIGEFISIMENLHRLGVPYVGQIAKALKIRTRQLAKDWIDQAEAFESRDKSDA